MVNGLQVLSDGAFGCRSRDRHSRFAGMDYINHWIPAFAGMTEVDSGLRRNDNGGSAPPACLRAGAGMAYFNISPSASTTCVSALSMMARA